jgi:prophage regulatory protein
MNNKQEQTEERILRPAEVLRMVGLSRKTIWAMEREGRFPKHIQLGKRIIAWKYSVIMEWIKNKS